VLSRDLEGFLGGHPHASFLSLDSYPINSGSSIIFLSLQMSFDALRHWKATMEYQKTRDMLRVTKALSHKNIKNTLIHINLEKAIFGSPQSDEFTIRVAHDLQEACKLIGAGLRCGNPRSSWMGLVSSFLMVCEVFGRNHFGHLKLSTLMLDSSIVTLCPLMPPSEFITSRA